MRFLSCATFSLICASGPASADLWGGRSQSEYQVTYQLIAGTELISHNGFMHGSHEILIPDTTFGELIVCQLFDVAGNVLETKHENSNSGTTRVYMVSESDVSSAICATTHVIQAETSSP